MKSLVYCLPLVILISLALQNCDKCDPECEPGQECVEGECIGEPITDNPDNPDNPVIIAMPEGSPANPNTQTAVVQAPYEFGKVETNLAENEVTITPTHRELPIITLDTRIEGDELVLSLKDFQPNPKSKTNELYAMMKAGLAAPDSQQEFRLEIVENNMANGSMTVKLPEPQTVTVPTLPCNDPPDDCPDNTQVQSDIDAQLAEALPQDPEQEYEINFLEPAAYQEPASGEVSTYTIRVDGIPTTEECIADTAARVGVYLNQQLADGENEAVNRFYTSTYQIVGSDSLTFEVEMDRLAGDFDVKVEIAFAKLEGGSIPTEPIPTRRNKFQLQETLNMNNESEGTLRSDTGNAFNWVDGAQQDSAQYCPSAPPAP